MAVSQQAMATMMNPIDLKQSPKPERFQVTHPLVANQLPEMSTNAQCLGRI
jgi:hypothetical protein